MLRQNLMTACFLSVAIASAGALWAGEKVAIGDLPAAVRAAVMERFPSGELVSAEKETDDGRIKFEVKVRSEGKKYEVEVSPAGKILDVDEDD